MKTRKLFSLLALVLCLCLLVGCLTACKDDEVTVMSIALKDGYKTAYEVGDTLDLTGLTVVVTMSDGTTKEEAVTAEMVTGFATTAAGEVKVKVTYEGKSVEFTINVSNPITAIAVNAGYTDTYPLGADFSVANTKITATYKDSSTKIVDVTADMVTGFDSSTVGTKTLTVTYEGKTAIYNVTITDASPVSFAFPEDLRTTYYVDSDNISDVEGGFTDKLDDITLAVTYSDESKGNVAVDSSMVSGFDISAVAAEKTVTITYSGIANNFDIEVVKLARTGMTVYKNGYKTLYPQNSSLELSYTVGSGEDAVTYNTMFVEAKFNFADYTEIVPITQEMIDFPSTADVGEKTVTVNYKGYTDTYKINVYTPTTVTEGQKVRNDQRTLVLSSSTMDKVFNPFFYSSAYDEQVLNLINASLLQLDRTGAVVCGDEYATVGKEWSYYYSNNDTTFEKKTDQTYAAGDFVVYEIVIKNGMKFSDGTPVTADDVLFNYYVYLDPAYSGSSTLYTLPIYGLYDYRTQIEGFDIYSTEANAILAQGRTYPEDGFAYTPEKFNKYWELFDEQGEAFVGGIVDYVNANYGNDAYVQAYFHEGLTYSDIAASEGLKIAYGMGMWGFGELSADKTKLIGSKTGTEYPVDTLSLADYWTEAQAGYTKEGVTNYALLEETESAGVSLLKPVEENYAKFYASDAGATSGVENIKGLIKGTKIDDDGTKYETVKVVLTKQNPKAILSLGVVVAPQDYYVGTWTASSEDAKVNYGVELNNPEYMAHLKKLNSAPVGAGPYKMRTAENGGFDVDDTIFLERNENFDTMGGEEVFNANIKFVCFKVLTLGEEYNALEAGDVDYSDPSATSDVMIDVASSQALKSILVDNLGYGYICINASVFPNLYERIALTTVFDIEQVYEYYPNGLADVIYRSMSQVSWAYPSGATAAYPFDGTCAKAIEYFKKAGYTFDTATGKFTDVPTYKFYLPSDAKDHPAGGIFLEAQRLLATIGVTAELKVDQNLIANIKEGNVGIYTLAWQAAADPDMYQVNHYASAAESVISNGIKWLYENGNDEYGTIVIDKLYIATGEWDAGATNVEMTQKEALKYLGDLIEHAMEFMLVEERKPVYAEALDVLALLNIEIPTYQRKNLYVYNSEIIDGTTLSANITPYWGPMAEIWKVSFADGVSGNYVA